MLLHDHRASSPLPHRDDVLFGRSLQLRVDGFVCSLQMLGVAVAALQVLNEFVHGDAAIFVAVCVAHDLIQFFLTQRVSQHHLQLLLGDVARVVSVEAPKGAAQHVVVERDARGHHGRQEIRVVDDLITRHGRLQGLEGPGDRGIFNVELLLQNTSQLAQGDVPAVIRVDLQEGFVHLRALLVGQGDGHHRQTSASEGRRL
mmetsp:Transcript_49832/g.118797  ORF Transcript_49832/g.118797 Transcript_49832/m.118797 type:complete len:201 (+) Transcript_49832:192-794(+)